MSAEPSVDARPPDIRGAAPAPILRTELLTVRFGGLAALNRVDFELNRGEVRAIIGPNGAGKSTFFNCLAGVLRPTSGRILFDGEDITGLSADRISQKGIARSYQITNILPNATALENVRVAAQSRRHSWNMVRHRDSFTDLTEKAEKSLASVGLLPKAHELAANLSHGEQRNLEIGIALATEPKLLCLDEPTAGMSAAETHETARLVSRHCEKSHHPYRRARHAIGDGACEPHHRVQLRCGAGRRNAGGNPAESSRARGLSQDMNAAASQPDPLVQVKDLHTYYGKSHILHGVSLHVGRGEVVGLLGRNGVGKSTTLKSIVGLVDASQGQVLYEGRPVTTVPAHKLALLGIAYVPEDRRIFRYLTVMENLRTGFDRHGVTEERRKALLDKVFSYFPVLAERRGQAGGTLSGGEQQMLAIARAMMLEPKIILLDEPTEGLMPRMVSQIHQIIDALHNEGVAILLVEQNVPLTLAASQRVYIMEKGMVRHHCAASELDVNHAVIKQFLGV